MVKRVLLQCLHFTKSCFLFGETIMLNVVTISKKTKKKKSENFFLVDNHYPMPFVG